eukprot:jgi/Bigna1/64278/fgenesh1_kg.71_\
MHDCKAQLLLAIGKNSEALNSAEAGLSLSPNQSALWITRGRIYRNMRRTREAVDSFRIIVNGSLPKASKETRLEAVDEMMEIINSEEETRSRASQDEKAVRQAQARFFQEHNIISPKQFRFTGSYEWGIGLINSSSSVEGLDNGNNVGRGSSSSQLQQQPLIPADPSSESPDDDDDWDKIERRQQHSKNEDGDDDDCDDHNKKMVNNFDFELPDE